MSNTCRKGRSEEELVKMMMEADCNKDVRVLACEVHSCLECCKRSCS